MARRQAAQLAARKALAHHLANPFLVLELAPNATRVEAERAGARLLASLAAGLPGATSYPTPLGPQPRDAELVRSALAAWREPDQRLVAAWWVEGW